MTNNRQLNRYEQQQEDRKAKYELMAKKLDSQSNSYCEASLEAIKDIPPGQPILIGHHSERRHRRDLDRSHNNMRKSIEATEKAEYYRDKAAAVGQGGISSDDPDAIQKLKSKLEDCQKSQELMKASNKLIRKQNRDGLKALGYTEANIDKLFQPDSCGRIGYAGFELANNGAEIRRLKKRIEKLVNNQQRKYKEIKLEGFTIIQNTDRNRLQLSFEDKPSDKARNILKSRSFKWSPSNGVWQRQLTNNAIDAVNQVRRDFMKLENGIF